MFLYDAILFIKYKYLKKQRYLDAYLQDLVASKTDFKPYKVKLLTAEKKNKRINEFNYFTFKYEKLTYELLDDKLKIISE